MKTRMDEVPALWVFQSKVEATIFNRIRLALLRLGEPQRIELKHLRGLDLLLGREAWVCVDRTLNDLPVIAWTHFEVAGREQLQAPVSCEIRYYHGHAGMIVRTALDDALEVLEQRLGGAAGSPVSTLPPHT